jgi:hypothetical protein
MSPPSWPYAVTVAALSFVTYIAAGFLQNAPDSAS